MNRTETRALMEEYTKSPSLRQHMLAVEAAMRAYAEKHGEDPETWGIVGLLHDFDYEKFPNHEHSPTEGHPAWGVRLLRDRSEEHTSELQSQSNLVCRLLLEKKKTHTTLLYLFRSIIGQTPIRVLR